MPISIPRDHLLLSLNMNIPVPVSVERVSDIVDFLLAERFLNLLAGVANNKDFCMIHEVIKPFSIMFIEHQQITNTTQIFSFKQGEDADLWRLSCEVKSLITTMGYKSPVQEVDIFDEL